MAQKLLEDTVSCAPKNGADVWSTPPYLPTIDTELTT